MRFNSFGCRHHTPRRRLLLKFRSRCPLVDCLPLRGRSSYCPCHFPLRRGSSHCFPLSCRNPSLGCPFNPSFCHTFCSDVVLYKYFFPCRNGFLCQEKGFIYSIISISIETFSGIGTRMTNLNARSSTPKSINLLWMRISKLSKLAFPLPQGLFLVVCFSLFVGRGIGP